MKAKSVSVLAAIRRRCRAGILLPFLFAPYLALADSPGVRTAMPVSAVPDSGPCRKAAMQKPGESFPDVPGGDIFGFTSPSDVGNPGDCAIAFELSGRVGKADGRYRAVTLKTQFSATIAENLAIAVAPFATHHAIGGGIHRDDRNRTRFDGLSGEISYRFIDRSSANPLAATFSFEPRWARIDSGSGAAATSYTAEFKLLIDAVLAAGRLYAALNLNYAPATQHLAGQTAWVSSSSTNLSGAIAYQFSDRAFGGLELRHQTTFEGAALRRNIGRALFVGPTALVKLGESTTLNFVWTPQIRGRSTASARRLDLDNFERHQLRMKFVMGL